MPRVAAIVEYDGTSYSGWQAQAHAPSVQHCVEEALSFVAGEAVAVTCAGRTDRGVHALGQVVHFDTGAARSPRAWVLGANSRLPDSVSIAWAGEPAPGFHARYSALRRAYRYCILNASTRSALRHGRCAWIHRPLDAAAMHAAAQALLGEHDFAAFRAVECQSKTTRRRVERIAVWREGDLVWLDVEANAFLHHMVRNIVGTLLEAQAAADPVAAVTRVLAGRDRRHAGATAPAAGLCLLRVDYPPQFAIPAPRGGFW